MNIKTIQLNGLKLIVSDGAQLIGFLRLIIICQMTTTVTDGSAYSFHSLNLHKILLVGLMEVGITAVDFN